MGKKIEEYKKQFKSEVLELIVRIGWCWEKGCSGFDMMDNYYRARASFDKALNVKTGEVLETIGAKFNLIEWLAPKKIFGFKYVYKFKKGNMYRILVREYIPKENEINKLTNKWTNKVYYIEQVLEKDIYEPRLDELCIFENKFEETVKDLTVLIKERIWSWGHVSVYRFPKATFIASIDNETNELSESYGTLTWMEKDRKSKMKFKFNFDELGIYHVKVRRNKENNNNYLLLDVLKKGTDDRLESVKEQNLKPVIINNEFGEFRLNRSSGWFEGQIDYLGEKCIVYLKVQEDETTADISLRPVDPPLRAVDIPLRKLNEIFGNLEDWDNHLRECISNELLEPANDWNAAAGEPELTKEQFLQRIGVPDITIHTDGTVELCFGSDDMLFGGDDIVVEFDENGNYKRQDLVE